MTKFKFVDELPRRQGGPHGNLDPVLVKFGDALRANPNTWAEYPNALTVSSRSRTVALINHGHGLASFGEGVFEAAVRNGVLYVRYVGKGKP